MRATGIVRRIDDLGRIVVPKEIRRTLRIREGDPLYSKNIRRLENSVRLQSSMQRRWRRRRDIL